MDVKGYLTQVQELEEKIEDQKQYIDSMRESLSSISCATDGERVKSSTDGDKFGKIIAKVVDGEEKLKKMQERLCILKCQIIDQIHQMDDIQLKELLLCKYIYWRDYKTLTDVGKKLGYSGDYMKKLHVKALFEFGRKLVLQNT